MRDYPSYFGHTYLVTPATQVPLSFTSQNEHLLAQHEGFPHSFAGHHTDISLGPENDAPCSSIHAMSDNYRGNRLNVANYSMDIPTILNTSLWITGLPFDVTVHELLQCIRGFGNIFALHLNRPEEGTGHFFSAAKLTFFKAEAAQRFLRSHERTGLVVGNLTASVRPNRIKVAEGDHPDHYSRVLVILRPADVTNEEWVSHQLSTRGIYWDTDDVFEYVHPVTGWVRLEFRFGSYRGQSSQAYRVLRGREARDRSIMVIFGLDPCASNEHFGVIASASAKFRKGLRSISYKGSNLIKITDAAALSTIARGFPFIRSIVIGGPAATPEVVMAGGRKQAVWMFQGAISGAALDELLKDKGLAANLELLDLGNQAFALNEKYEEYGESVIGARRRLYYVDGYGGDRNLYFGGEMVDSNVDELALTAMVMTATTMTIAIERRVRWL
ncbi:hypothetical protein QBC40DRAFT_265281 [Triangularia verruculosa]|uniref:RRM domain-containing protein n=1 Tax=Triangularia verruculosa TaxID=2587418 RepID=A0AAN6XGC3_9PEZI|nr:hypothetical protein QBC40DRAFT_265281 [Triangularia verruculosa]